MKTIFNNSLNTTYLGKNVTVYGWVNKIRKLGGLIFIDLRDRSGIVQLSIKEGSNIYEIASDIKNEYVLKASGVVVERENKNPNLETGEIEINVEEIEVLNTSLPLPFELDKNSLEETRLKYRYIDLRREEIKNNLIMRHKITSSIRRFLDENGFIEIETPILTKSTPEGARDYLVPSRVYKGSFYALPQSPQLFKQLLMVSGYERYYQFARCFRDEDLRSDRQPEFTQIDMEMSFASEEDVYEIVEKMISTLMKEVKNYNISLPLPRITYDEAIKYYGTDKPDTRYEMLINSLDDVFSNSGFKLFEGVSINAIVVKNASDKYSRKKIEELERIVKNFKVNNLFYLKFNNNELTGSIVKNLTDIEKEELIKKLELKENDLVLITADEYKKSKNSLGALRVKIAKDLNLASKDKFNYLWVTDFPMFEYSEVENRYISAHHPFTMPKDIDKLNDPENCYARSYDLVLNGYELASGSVRIHDKNVQKKVFEALHISDEEAEEKFGFLLKAFNYGAPPHAGIAPGLERLTMILCGTDDIKDVVAFPKTQSAACLLTDAPSGVNNEALNTLGIKVEE